MIERQTINGREALVAYLTSAMEPTDSDQAELVKVIFEDNGETMWLVPVEHEVEQ